MLAFFQGRKETPRLGTLRQLALFSTLSRLELRVVDGLLHERRFLKGEIIFDEGEEGQALHVVIAGKVLICKQGQETRPLATLSAGSFFGELALLDDAPRSAQARAAGNCKLLVLFRGDFLGLMQSHGLIASKIAMQLARHLASRVRSMSRGDTGPV